VACKREEVIGILGMKHADNLTKYDRDDLITASKMDRTSTTYRTEQKLHIKFW
jgi:hypothetical protein